MTWDLQKGVHAIAHSQRLLWAVTVGLAELILAYGSVRMKALL